MSGEKVVRMEAMSTPRQLLGGLAVDRGQRPGESLLSEVGISTQDSAMANLDVLRIQNGDAPLQPQPVD